MSDRFDVRRRFETPSGIRYGAVDLQAGCAARLQRIPEDGSEYELDEPLFTQAAEVLPTITHPNLVQVLELGLDPDGAYAASAIADGVELLEFVQAQGPLNVKDVVSVAKDCLLGMAALDSAGWRHGYPSPHRVFVRRGDDNRLAAQLSESGFTLLAQPPDSMSPGTALPWREMGFVAPEVILHHTADVRADLHTLGCTLYFCLTGNAPFGGATQDAAAAAHLNTRPKPLLQWKRDLPPKLTEWIMTLLEPDPANRPSTPDQALELLETARGRAPLPTPTPAAIAAPRQISRARAPVPVIAPQIAPALPAPSREHMLLTLGLLAITILACGYGFSHGHRNPVAASAQPASDVAPNVTATAPKNLAPVPSVPSSPGNPMGRYVRIELPEMGTLTIPEVEVYSDGKNIARRGTASQSTTAFNGAAGRAIDGNTNGEYFANTSSHTHVNDPHPWWELDLSRSERIQAVTIWARTDGNGIFVSRLEGYQIVVFDDKRREVYRSARNAAPKQFARIELIIPSTAAR